MEQTTYDVVVIGGGAAGLAGALVLARARRKVLVVDAGKQRNLPAHGVHNYLGREGVSPAELVRVGAEEVRSYGGEVDRGTVTAARPGFEVDVDGRTLAARRLLVTTGLVDELPEVPGLREQWGRGVFHCPYCHGYEVRDQPLAVLATGPMAAHQALLLTQWTSDVVLAGPVAPSAPDLARLGAAGVRVVPGQLEEVVSTDGVLTGVRVGGELLARSAVAVAPRFAARSQALTGLGLGDAPYAVGDAVLGTHVPAGPTGLSSVPGVWLAGNVTDPMATVAVAAAAGTTAGAAINADLVGEDTGRLLR